MSKTIQKHSSQLRLVFVLWFIWRLFLFLIAAWGTLKFPFQPRFPYADVYLISSKLPSWIWSFANFDGVHYLGISQKGYFAQYSQVFFPLFPLTLRLFSNFLPNLNSIAIGLIFSSTAFLMSLIIFYKLLEIDNVQNKKWILLFLVTFPTAFFWGSLYTESFFFLLILISFYFSRRGQWWLASVFGGFASGTRLVGIFILPALLWEWYKASNFRKEKKLSRAVFYIVRSPILYIVPIGLISYMLFLHFYYGDVLYFWHAQPVFGAERTSNTIILLPQVFYRYFKILITNSPLNLSFWIPLLELSTTILGLVTLIISHSKGVRLSYLIFSWCAFIIPTLTGTFSSMPRYVLILFPMYIVLSNIKNRVLKILILSLFIILQGILTILFTTGHWVA